MKNFDLILQRLGDFKLFQIYQYILLGLCSVSTGIHTLANVFYAYVPEHWCDVPGLENLTHAERQRISAPYDSEAGKYSVCEIFDLDYNNLDINELLSTNATIRTNRTRECTQWIYGEGITNAVTTWDLVCWSSWKRATFQSIYMLGFLVGCVLFGAMADRFGRKNALMTALLLMCMSGGSAAFAPNYWIFTWVRFFSGVGAAGAITCSFVLSMEIIGLAKRMVPGIVFQGWFAIGTCIVALLAYLISDFRILQAVISLFPLASLFEYWFICKSPRWLLTQGRIPEAIAEVKRAARINNVEYPSDLMPSSTDESEKWKLLEHEDEPHTKKPSVIDLLRSRALRWITLNVFYNWFVNSLVFYGLSMGVSALAGGRFINMTIFGLLEFPGYLICCVTLDRVGRRLPLAGLMISGGVACLLTLAVPDDLLWLRTSFAMIGKLTISGSFAQIYVYSAELFPTVVRNIGVGAGSMHARIGGLVAPFVAELGIIAWWPLPGIIFGAASVLAGVLALLLPETLNKSLPETMEDAEKWRSAGFGCCSKKKDGDKVTMNGNVENGHAMKDHMQMNGHG